MDSLGTYVGMPRNLCKVSARAASSCSFFLQICIAINWSRMDKSESKGSGHPEEEKTVSPIEKPPGKEKDLVDQVWERFVKTTHQALSWNEGFKEENSGLGLRIQDLYCAILLLYNDINKTWRPGPHREPPTKSEVQKCIKTDGEINEDTMLDRAEFNFFFEMFTKNTIRRDELQAFFKTGTKKQQSVRLGSHSKQESGCSSQEPGPSRNVKTDDSEDLYMKKSKELKNADSEELKASNGSWNVLRHGRTDSAVNLNSFSGGSHFQIFNFASADLDSLATFVKQIRK